MPSPSAENSRRRIEGNSSAIRLIVELLTANSGPPTSSPASAGLPFEPLERKVGLQGGPHTTIGGNGDKVAAEKGYAGPVVVCSLHYEPIAGHNPSNSLVKYLSEGSEMEVALAPIRGTRLLAPFRLSVTSILGNVLIEANQFEAAAAPLEAATVADPKSQ